MRLYEHLKNNKLGFKKFIFSKHLSLDKNISKLSNFFATQNPIFFEKIDENEKEKINLIEKYLKAENIEEEKPKDNQNDKIKLENTHTKITMNNENELRNYINSRNIFQFYNNNGINVYSIKFNEEFSDKKNEIFNNGIYMNSIYADCSPFCQLKNGKWVFKICVNKEYWICLLQQNDKIFEIETLEKIHIKEYNGRCNLFEINEDKFLIYENYSPDINLVRPYTHKTRIYIINSRTGYMNKEIVIPLTNGSIENLFYLDKYKNILFIFLAFPLLNLVLLDFELNQINTIIDIINPLYETDIYEYRPIIKDIKILKNNKLCLIGGQLPNVNDAHPDYNYYYDFKIIYNLDNFEIECAENYYINNNINTFIL